MLTFFSVYFNSVELCMALQCNPDDIKFIPQQCSKSFEKVCENMSKFDYSLYSLYKYQLKIRGSD